MRELVGGIWALLGATLVSIVQIPCGFIYSFFYGFWLSITLVRPFAFFLFWWRLFDGLCAALGHALYHIAFALDLSWCVLGENLEDMITHEEDTPFGQKNITVSATVGKIEIEGKLNRYGHWCSRVLNVVFGQKAHAVDSWNFNVAKKKLQEGYFHKREK